MDSVLVNMLVTLLEKLTKELKEGKYHCSDAELSEALEQLSKFNSEKPMSKEQACNYLGMSRSSFDGYIRMGFIPKGKKVLGFKELSWTKMDLDKSIKKIKNI